MVCGALLRSQSIFGVSPLFCLEPTVATVDGFFYVLAFKGKLGTFSTSCLKFSL